MMDERAKNRFWAKVAIGGPDECWEWQGANDGRYGQFHLEGKTHKAHRIAWHIEHGEPLSPDLLACHKCDNPPCVNPSHIFAGTMSANIKDAVKKNRWVAPTPKGAKLSHCQKGHKFTPENTYVRPSGERACRTCIRAGQRRRRRSTNEGEGA